jgi:hypothetical protein
MSRRQRGASLLIPVVLIVTAGAFAVIVAAGQSGADIEGTNAQAEGTEALFLAETGIERATRRFLAGSACSAAGLSENLANLATIGIAAGRTITISAGANSNRDFGGVLLPATQCRIQATGRVTASNVSRTLQAIIDRTDNLIGGPLVAGFDNPAGAVNPAASWTGPAPVAGGSIGGYDYTGGNTAGVNPPNCTRSAYLVKPNAGGGTPAASTVGTAPVAFTISRPATVTVSFDYRIVRIRDANDDTCGTNSAAASCTVTSPTIDATSPETAGNGDGQICFTLRDSAGVTYNSTRAEVDASVDNSGGGNFTVIPPTCAPTNQQLATNPDFTPCSLRYNYSGGTGGGSLLPATVRFTFAAGAPLSFDQVGFKMYRAAGGNAFEMWLDNIRVTPNATIAGIAGWRDCSVSACPAV